VDPPGRGRSGAGVTRSTATDTTALAGDTGPRPRATTVIAVVTDLFFVARIRETARGVGVPLVLARSSEELAAALEGGARFVLVDLTGRFDFEAVFGVFERLDPSVRPPVLGYTTHAMAKATQPWHGRCARVVTKETLTQELAGLLREGIAR
jgi:hypothetical protein